MNYPFIWDRVNTHFPGESFSTWQDVIDRSENYDWRSLPWYIRETVAQVKMRKPKVDPQHLGLLFYQNWMLSGLSQIIGKTKNINLSRYAKLTVLAESIELASSHIEVFKTLSPTIQHSILQKILEVEKMKNDKDIKDHRIYSMLFYFLQQMMDMTQI